MSTRIKPLSSKDYGESDNVASLVVGGEDGRTRKGARVLGIRSGGVLGLDRAIGAVVLGVGAVAVGIDRIDGITDQVVAGPGDDVDGGRAGDAVEDAFAASLLMPRDAFSEQLNAEEPSLDVIQELAANFQTSIVATLYRAANRSHFPCAVVCVKDGNAAWCFSSPPLIDAGCYPPERAPLQSKKALAAWNSQQQGVTDLFPAYSQVRSWFRTYDKEELLGVNVKEEYLALPWRNDILIFLTINEDELAEALGNNDDSDDDDD